MIRAVYFDIGETLVDRTREFGALADSLGIPRHTFSAVFGGTVVRGGGVPETLAHFTSETWVQLRRRSAAPALCNDDLYGDVRPCFAALSGYRLGIVGNQPDGVRAELAALDLPVDSIATSADWGVAKPAGDFFAHIVADAGCAPQEIVYVGDQIDKDIRPALATGLQAVRILRGPWGYLVRDAVSEHRCRGLITSLEQLPELLRERETVLPSQVTD